jgi:hypothetical protein
MLRRIDWDTPPLAARAGEVAGATGAPGGGKRSGIVGEEEEEEDLPPNSCHLVNHGMIVLR